jgi:hypothetical protein
MYADNLNYEFVMGHAARGDFAFLLGSVEDDPETGVAYNTAKLLTARGEQVDTYRKIHLVPYGEYLPMRPLLEPIAGGLVPGDFTAGTEPVVFDAGAARKIAALIASRTSWAISRAASPNARTHREHHQRRLVSHLRLRAVGTTPFFARLKSAAAVRCANTGITCSSTAPANRPHWSHIRDPAIRARLRCPPIAVPVASSFYPPWRMVRHIAVLATLVAMGRRFCRKMNARAGRRCTTSTAQPAGAFAELRRWVSPLPRCSLFESSSTRAFSRQ